MEKEGRERRKKGGRDKKKSTSKRWEIRCEGIRQKTKTQKKKRGGGRTRNKERKVDRKS
jgi:hypothetical protein